MPVEMPFTSVDRISGTLSCTLALAFCVSSTPRLANQPRIFSSAGSIFAEMSPDCAEMPPKTRAKMSTPTATSPSRTRIAPPMRGTRWRSSHPTAGPATAPSTAATITGMTIVDVSPSSQTTPTMIRTKPTSSHDVKPRSLSHVGAENRTSRSGVICVMPCRVTDPRRSRLVRHRQEWTPRARTQPG